MLKGWTDRMGDGGMVHGYSDRAADAATQPASAGPPGPHDADGGIDATRDALDALDQLDCHYDAADATLWTFMRPHGRASFNAGLLADFAAWQRAIDEGFAGAGGSFEGDAARAGAKVPGDDPRPPLDWLVLGSRMPGVFCYGGDLDLFARLIRSGDRDGLIAYGRACVTILHRNWQALGRRLVTVGRVAGDALGGGWEALMSFDVVIAERGTRFSLPEISFGLFPGMGAHAMLSRKVGSAVAQRIIGSGTTMTAEALHELGLVHVLAEPGDAVATTRAFIRRERRRHAGLVGAQAAMRLANPLTLDELVDIVTLWADTALRLSDSDVRLMERIVGAQARRAGAADRATDPRQPPAAVAA